MGNMEPDELAQKRVALGLSINGLARALGVAPSSVMRWEKGTYTPPRWLDRAMRDVEREQQDQEPAE
jgi:DNA-binding transcriptional regulator YiaG